MPRFDPVYRLLVGKPGQQGREILPPLHMTFEVEKDTEEDPNYAKIRVWNLRKETRDELVTPDNFVVLYVGYAEEAGPILLTAGTLVYGYSYHDGPDVVTELEILDGYANLRDTVVSLGYGPGVRARQIITEIAKQMGLHLVMADDEPDRVWKNGFSYYGIAHRALHKVTSGTGLEWSVQNNELQVITRRGTTPRQGIVLAADSGLIGYPVRTRKGAREKAKVTDEKTGKAKNITSAKQQKDGWRVTSLILPTVNPGDLVKLESRSVDAWFRVETVKHSGDYGGTGEFLTELELVEPNAPPKNEKKTKGRS